AFQPYWGKPAARNDREDRGNVGIIRSPLRASILPDRVQLDETCASLSEIEEGFAGFVLLPDCASSIRATHGAGGVVANLVDLYPSFEGRLARLPFFGRGVFLGVIAAALGMASIPFFSREGLWWWLGILIVAAALVLLFVGGVSLTIRRLHD